MNHTARLTPSEQAILDLIMAEPDRFTLDDLASEVGCSSKSAKVLISRLRAKGHAISSPRHRCQAGPRKGVPQTYRLEGGAPDAQGL